MAVSDASRELADKIVEHFRTVDAEGSDYLRNAQIIARAGYCSPRGLGIACSLVAGYQTALSRAVARQEALKSVWVGAVNERREFSATVVRVLEFPSQFGCQVKTIMNDDAGNILVCNGLKVGGVQAVVGSVVRFVATIKEHALFRNAQQTVLLRPKL